MEKTDSSETEKLDNNNRQQRFFLIFISIFLFFNILNISAFLTLPHNSGKVYAQSGITCDLCKQRILGKYWQTGGKSYCDKCYRSYPHCKICRAPMKKYYEIDGKKICPHCYNFKLIRCSGCNSPLFTYWIKDGRKYCKKCLDEMADKCELCHKPLYGRFWIMNSMVTGEEKKYCDSCKNSTHTCYICGMPIPSRSKSLPDGRYICGSCGKTAINNSAQYETILTDVSKRFEKIGLHIKHKPTLNVVDLDTLKKIQKETEGLNTLGDKMGYYRCTKMQGTNAFGRKYSSIIKADIYILKYIPSDVAYRVLSHELAHAWHEERMDARKPQLIIEGFAEWVSYTLLRQKGLKHMAKSMTTRNDVYGKGLKEMLRIQKKRGFKGVLEYVTQ